MNNGRLPRLSECFVALGCGGHDVRHATVLVGGGGGGGRKPVIVRED